jgi:starch phosphorylase
MSITITEKTVIPIYSIPQQIQLLEKLSKNLWWSWNHEAQNIFAELSPRLWSRFNHNPILVMNNISNEELTAVLSDQDFSEKLNRVLNEFETYLSDNNTWADKHASEFKTNPVAYFSAEFGLHESLPIYSGGLGILAGDHIKSASDIGLNFVGITLFYREGYFNQQISNDGWQQEEYALQNPDNLPLHQILDENGEPVTITVEVAHSLVKVAAWEIHVGRAKLILLDTNLEENEGHYRDISCHVYGDGNRLSILI